jgi:peroxiredoxin
VEVGGVVGVLGLVVVAGAIVVYALMLFVVHRFTYRTWIFHIAVAFGMVLALVGWGTGGANLASGIALAVGAVWFPLVRRELRIRGSEELLVRRGDQFPTMDLVTTQGEQVTDRDLASAAPALLVLYRGWWCPSHKSQLDELVAAYERLSDAGLSVFAASVDTPDDAEQIQQHVGDKIVILCNVPVSLLDELGTRDTKGAPWYDRLIFGAKKQDIAMPTGFVIDVSGTVVYSYRATTVDDRPDPDRILASL